jgi:hypothetical protein
MIEKYAPESLTTMTYPDMTISSRNDATRNTHLVSRPGLLLFFLIETTVSRAVSMSIGNINETAVVKVSLYDREVTPSIMALWEGQLPLLFPETAAIVSENVNDIINMLHLDINT